jgi:hypothetical protein
MPRWPEDVNKAVLESVGNIPSAPDPEWIREQQQAQRDQLIGVLKQAFAVFLMLLAVIMAGAGGAVLWGIGGCLLCGAVPLFITGVLLGLSN